MGSAGGTLEHAGTEPVPIAGNVAYIILAMVNSAVLAVFLTQRVQAVQSWRCLPIARWLILIIYVDSLLFVFLTTLFFKGVGIDGKSLHLCYGAQLLCEEPIRKTSTESHLTDDDKFKALPVIVQLKYVAPLCLLRSTSEANHTDEIQVAIYYFLVEKVYIVRMPTKTRMKSKLYLLNSFGVMGPYVALITLTFKFRFAYLDGDEQCFIGIKRFALISVISFELVLNAYLTTLFIVPLRRLYAYRNDISSALRTVAIRSFIGSCATTASNISNLTVLMALIGEKGWICLLCCNADILFTVLVLHWVSSVDTESGSNPADISFHFRSWIAMEDRDRRRNAGTSAATGTAADSETTQDSIGRNTLGGVKSQTVPIREVHFHEEEA